MDSVFRVMFLGTLILVVLYAIYHGSEFVKEANIKYADSFFASVMNSINLK